MLLTEQEKREAVTDVAQLILSSNIFAIVMRIDPGERLYGNDDESYVEIDSIPIEIVETPPEDLAKRIDATASILPDEDVRTEDRLRIQGCVYRIQTIENEHFFGTTTHKTIKLVKIHGS